MDEVYQRKRILVRNVFEKAREEYGEGSINALAEYLSNEIEKRFGFVRNVRAFTRYHAKYMEGKKLNFDEATQNILSKYLGYKDFNDFCQNISIEKEHGDTNVTISINEDEESLSQKISKIFVTVTTTVAPVFNLSEFFHNNKANMGIMGIILAGSLIGGVIYKKDRPGSGITTKTQLIIQEKKCMYWNDSAYTSVACEDKTLYKNIIPVDSLDLKNFRKITRPDTLTSENAIDKVWYSKRWSKVDFFTTTNRKGTNPKNGATLRPVTETIIEKYAHENK
ncbi:hypothetical protein [Elizabethkingia meningoseptica]|uniref:hypothetical protein n=1 Tax=Elizabethkingia meningoseptica TaxID=238 RepID=UPI002DD65DDA|nr:hypothetical protein [Elizabethkingia meningoseptica]MEC4712923.1 hypothetical protein [Elizabethkingia meningoseptica]